MKDKDEKAGQCETWGVYLCPTGHDAIVSSLSVFAMPLEIVVASALCDTWPSDLVFDCERSPLLCLDYMARTFRPLWSHGLLCGIQGGWRRLPGAPACLPVTHKGVTTVLETQGGTGGPEPPLLTHETPWKSQRKITMGLEISIGVEEQLGGCPHLSWVLGTRAEGYVWCNEQNVWFKICKMREGSVWIRRWLNCGILQPTNDARPRQLVPVSIFPRLVSQWHGRVQRSLQHSPLGHFI